MFSVIHSKYLFIYPDLASAISYFFSVNKNKDISIQPNINGSFKLLSSQCNIFQIPSLSSELERIPVDSIINISIFRDEDESFRLGSALLCLSPDQIDSLATHYKTYSITYKTKKCAICNSNFKIWNRNNAGVYLGCTYNPLYYRVITPENLENYHLFGHCPEEDATFYLNVSGQHQGLYASKNTLPDNLEHGSYICWSCMNLDDYIYIWAH